MLSNAYFCLCCPLQAIESFAVTVKEIAQLLQTFGTELSEIELPDEASGIEYLLRSHTEKYRQMKVWKWVSQLGLCIMHI